VAYLDNNATTQPSPGVLNAVAQGLAEYWQNPSSVHRAGQSARARVEIARGQVASLLNVRAREVTFTSSGTESIDLALRGTLLAWASRKDRRDGEPLPMLVTSKVEHAAVRDLAQELEALKLARLHWCAIDAQGLVSPSDLAALLAQERNGARALVSVQWANNETGAIQNVAEIFRTCREHGALFHCDATQWIGKEPIVPHASGDAMPSSRHRTAALPADMLTCSPHKFHGPKGVGVLWCGPHVRLRPTLCGTQELGRRGGTENVAGIMGAGVAAEEAQRWLESWDESTRATLSTLRDRLESGILRAWPGAHVNGPASTQGRLWNTTNIAFPTFEAEALLLRLSEWGLCASAGAACSSGSLDPSPVLLAMGVSEVSAHGSLRFSLSRYTTADEIERAIPLIVRLREQTT
jgi:cysteine desulfurase